MIFYRQQVANPHENSSRAAMYTVLLYLSGRFTLARLARPKLAKRGIVTEMTLLVWADLLRRSSQGTEEHDDARFWDLRFELIDR